MDALFRLKPFFPLVLASSPTLRDSKQADWHQHMAVKRLSKEGLYELIAWLSDPVEMERLHYLPSSLTPAALVLSSEGLIDCPQVTFGCNYDLDVRSFELRRGYARARCRLADAQLAQGQREPERPAPPG